MKRSSELNSDELCLLSEILSAHRLDVLEALQKANTQDSSNPEAKNLLAKVLIEAECKMLVDLLELNKSIAAKLGV